MQGKIWERFLLVLRWLIAAIFIFAGAGKIFDPANFAQQVDNYRLLPFFMVTLMAIVLPWLEVLCGILLLHNRYKTPAAFIVLLMCFMFLLAIGSAVIRGLDISCGCFSVDSQATKVGFKRLIEDVFLFGGVFLLYFHLIKTNETIIGHGKEIIH